MGIPRHDALSRKRAVHSARSYVGLKPTQPLTRRQGVGRPLGSEVVLHRDVHGTWAYKALVSPPPAMAYASINVCNLSR